MTQTSGLCPLHLQQQHVNPSSDGNIISSIPYPKVFGYLIPTLAAVVGANVQGTTKPLIKTHGVSLYLFLVAIILHYIAFAVDKTPQRNQANSSQFWSLAAVTFGSLSAVALISTFCKNSVAEIICYIALGCAVIFILVYQCGRKFVVTCGPLYRNILKPNFSKTLESFQANNNNNTSSSEQEQANNNNNTSSSEQEQANNNNNTSSSEQEQPLPPRRRKNSRSLASAKKKKELKIIGLID